MPSGDIPSCEKLNRLPKNPQIQMEISEHKVLRALIMEIAHRFCRVQLKQSFEGTVQV